MNNILLHELSKLDNFHNLSNVGNTDVVTEWIKVYSYEIEKDKKYVYVLYKKTGKELTIDELEKLRKYKENKRKINILKKYQNNKCNEFEYIEVYNLIQKPIAGELLNILDKNELIEAREKISLYLKMSNDELNDKIIQMKENISNLSIVDIYVLHIILDVNFTHSLGVINRMK